MSAPARDIVDLCRKLLRLQRRAGTAAEAQAAANALARLLDKHRIEIAQLEVGGEKPPDSAVVDRDVPLYRWKRLDPWRWDLAVTLCNHYGVVAWQHRAYLGDRRVLAGLHLCGTPTNIALVRELWAWLTAEATRLSRAQCRGRGRVFHNSWLLGFVRGVEKQLRRARESAEHEAQASGRASAALVVWGDERRRAEEALAASLGPLDTYEGESRGHLDPRAYVRGVAAGAEVHLGRRIAADGDATDDRRLLPG